MQGPLGELHLLVYGIQPGEAEFSAVLGGAQSARAERGRAMLERLARLGVEVSLEDLERQAAGAPIGRPHVARALIARGVVRTIDEAFDRFLGRGRPCFVPKTLPELEAITALVRRVGGVSSAAHLAGRGVGIAGELVRRGVDGLEVVHPRHTETMRRELAAAAEAHGLLPTGGSDWHGGDAAGPKHGRLGDVRIPLAWGRALQQLIGSRRGG